MQNKPITVKILRILSAFLMGVGLTFAQQSVDGEIFNPQLLDAYHSYDQTMSIKKNPLFFESGQMVDNCSDYFEQSKISTIKEEVNNQIMSQEYIICDSVKLLKSTNKDVDTQYQPKSYGRELFQRLDLRTFPSSIRQMIDDKNFVFSSLKVIPLKISEHSVVSDTDDWFLKFEVVANLDLDNDGKRDWLLWFIDEAKNGNYRSYSVLIINNVSKTGFLHAKVLH